MSEANSADVLETLAPIWHSKAETVRAVRQRLRMVLVGGGDGVAVG